MMMIDKERLDDCIKAIEERLKESDMKLSVNTPLRDGYKKALEILINRITDYKDAQIEKLKTTQARAIAFLAIDFLNGECEKEQFVRIPTKKNEQ